MKKKLNNVLCFGIRHEIHIYKIKKRPLPLPHKTNEQKSTNVLKISLKSLCGEFKSTFLANSFALKTKQYYLLNRKFTFILLANLIEALGFEKKFTEKIIPHFPRWLTKSLASVVIKLQTNFTKILRSISVIGEGEGGEKK